jgi:hypothetical protein
LVEKGQFPLIDGDLFDEGFFHFVLGIPGVGEAVEESFEFGAVFAGNVPLAGILQSAKPFCRDAL